MSRDVVAYLDDILESIERIDRYCQSIDEIEFYRNTEKQDAIIRRLEIIGEAVKKIPQEIRDKYCDVPWKEIAGMRDIVVHEYFEVSLEIVWRTLVNEFHRLKNKLKLLGRT